MKRPGDALPHANTKVAKAKPQAASAKPNAAKAKPKAATAQPKAAKAKPKAAKAKPKATKVKPEAATAPSAAVSAVVVVDDDDAPLISLAPTASSSSTGTGGGKGGGKGAKGGGGKGAKGGQWVDFLAFHGYKKVRKRSKHDQSHTGLGMAWIEQEGGGTFDWEHTDDEGLDDEEVLAAWDEWLHPAATAAGATEGLSHHAVECASLSYKLKHPKPPYISLPSTQPQIH